MPHVIHNGVKRKDILVTCLCEFSRGGGSNPHLPATGVACSYLQLVEPSAGAQTSLVSLVGHNCMQG